MNKKYLLIPIEVISRELDSRVLISLRLLMLNPEWEIIIGKTNKVGDYWRNNSLKGKKFIYLSKGTIYSKLFYINLLKNGGYYFLLDEEGAIYSQYITKVIKRGGENNDLIQLMSKIFFWGENTKKDYIARHSKYLSNDKIEVTGNPRFDLCKKEYENFINFKSKNIFKKNQFILIDTAFGMFNNIVDQKLEYEHWKSVKYENNRGENDMSKWFQNFSPLYEYQKKIFPDFLDGIIHISNKFKDVNFLIRPHPVENIETYSNYFKNIKNIKITNDGTAIEKIIYSKLLIHNGCTTAIEALFHEIPSICFLPQFEKDKVQSLPREISFEVYDKFHLENKINDIFEKNYDPSFFLERKKIVKKYIDNVDYDSSKKIAKIINDFNFQVKLKFKYDKTLRSLAHILLPKRIVSFIQFANKYIKSSFMSKSSQNAFKKRDIIKFNDLTINDLNLRIDSFMKVDSNFEKVNVIKIDEHLFKIYIQS